MIKYIIEAPEHQTQSQRLSTYSISLIGWLLWLYVSFPLITVCGHLLHVDFCSSLIRHVGGIWSLQSLLQIYGLTLLCLSGLWACWILYRLRQKQFQADSSASHLVNEADLCERFQIESNILQQSLASRSIDVAFDAKGQIVALLPKVSDFANEKTKLRS